MKTTLTPEQSQRLIELGVAPNKASMCMLYFPESDSSEPLEAWQVWEENGKLLCNPDESQVQDVECVIVPKSADYDLDAKEEYPIFTLSDVLSLLPTEIGATWLYMSYQDGIEWNVAYESYDYGGNPIYEDGSYFTASELLDALYELLCWVLQNHPDKIKKTEK